MQWTAPADDGGSPLTGFQMILQKDGTEIKKINITDSRTTSYSVFTGEFFPCKSLNQREKFYLRRSWYLYVNCKYLTYLLTEILIIGWHTQIF